MMRWCNNEYKLDAQRQLNDFMLKQCYYVVYYIGYCADEENRYNKRIIKQGQQITEIYPLVENVIIEDDILEWAKTQPIFNNYYKTNKRCGCMYCPMADKISRAYLLKYYPDNFAFMIERMRETEKMRETEWGRPYSIISSNPKYNADYLDNIIRTKWLKILNEKENGENEQLNLFVEEKLRGKK